MTEKKSNLAAGLLIVLVLVVLVAGLAVLAWWLGGEDVPQRTLLEVDLEQALIEYVPEDPIASILMEDRMTLRDLVETLKAAAEDEHVVGIVARVAPASMGLAQVEEIRDAIAQFRASGKPAIAYADTFGEVVPGNAAYYLATAFDEIYIQPSGDVGLTGLSATSPFINGTLQKIGVAPHWSTRYEYKNAGNIFTETEYTEAQEEAMTALIGSMFDRMVDEIAAARGLSQDEVRTLIDHGPILGFEAEQAGLVDGLLYRDQVYDRVRELIGDEPVPVTASADDVPEGNSALLYLTRYRERATLPWAEGDDTIALVYAIGAVQRGESSYDPFAESFVMGSESVSAALRSAIRDDSVKAIILRVDSPGGSYVASDSIWREVERAQAAGKPVIASMGELAASGGYFVSMGADKIVAHPTTITGSIGVLGGKFETREMWNKLGITFDSVKFGDHADMWSGIDGFDESEWAKLDEWLDRVYLDFTTKAAQGRDMPLEALQAVAKGRVWSGADALDLRLVDELGGYPTAIRLAREAAGLDPEAAVRLRQYPKVQSPFQALFGEGPENSRQVAMRAGIALVLQKVRPLVEVAYRAGLLEPIQGPIQMQPIDGPK